MRTHSVQRTTSQGLERGTYITVAQRGGRRKSATVYSVYEDRGRTIVCYLDTSSRFHDTTIDNVRVERAMERRRKAVKQGRKHA